MHAGVQDLATNGGAGAPSVWACIAIAIALGGICFFCLREGMMLMTMKKTEQTPPWVKVVGAALVILGFSSVLVAFRHLQ
jgi:hypothetical protein